MPAGRYLCSSKSRDSSSGYRNHALVVAVRVFRPEAPLMRGQYSAVVAQEIKLVNIDANEHLLVAVLWLDGVIMRPAQDRLSHSCLP